MKILVTGGAGFIGSALVRRLVLEEKCSVLNLDVLTYAASLASLHSIAGDDSHKLERTNIADFEKVLSAFLSFKPDQVIHLAAESHVDRAIEDATNFITTNVLGTFTMLEAALTYFATLNRDAKAEFRFLHVSTDEVFGSLPSIGSFNEHSPYNPSSPYSASKASADHLVRAWSKTYGLPTIICNASNNFGPFQYPEKLVPLTILNAAEGKAINVYKRGEHVRDWMHVDDHVDALITVLQNGKINQTYLIGTRSERTNLEIVRRICQLIDEKVGSRRFSSESLVRFVEDRPGHDQRYSIDPTALENEFAWRPREPFDIRLEQTVDWYLDNAWWWAPLRRQYAGDRIGLRDFEV